MENLEFILKENVETDGEKVSTFGYKFAFGGKWYGNYVVVNNPSATAQDIMNALETLCPEIEQRLKELQAEIEGIDLKMHQGKHIFGDCTTCTHAHKIGDHEWDCNSDNYDIEHFTCYSPVDSGN